MKSCIAFFFLSLVVSAENTIFVDAAFPYRIVCRTGWVQETKNDTVLILKNSSAGKKTRLQLQKYSIDSGFDLSNNGWSRLRFAVNKELATNIGRLMWFDSTTNKKLGSYRAFELCAYYSEKSDNGILWWAEYSRWTDHNGFGYLASIIGDTSDIRQNCTTIYKTILDSISISQLSTDVISNRLVFFPSNEPGNSAAFVTPWYDVSGKAMRRHGGIHNAVMVNKNSKRLLLR
jgi:hypothetical protein